MEEHREERPKPEEEEEAPSFYYKEPEKEHKKESHSEEAITIRIKPRHLERAVFITIIVVLAILLVFNLASKKAAEPATTGGELTTSEEEQQEQLGEEDVTLDISGLKDEDDDTVKVTEKSAEPSEEEQGKEMVEIKKRVSADKVDLTIDEIEIEKKKDASGEYSWGKISLIYLTVSNLDRKFIPSFEIYAYDEETKDLELSRPKIVYNLDLGINEGQKKVLTIDTSKVSISGQMDSEKTVLVRLIDQELNRTIKEVSKTVTIS